MVDLPRIMLSQNSSSPTQESERIEAQRDLGGGQREAFREIFEQSICLNNDISRIMSSRKTKGTSRKE